MWTSVNYKMVFDELIQTIARRVCSSLGVGTWEVEIRGDNYQTTTICKNISLMEIEQKQCVSRCIFLFFMTATSEDFSVTKSSNQLKVVLNPNQLLGELYWQFLVELNIILAFPLYLHLILISTSFHPLALSTSYSFSPLYLPLNEPKIIFRKKSKFNIQIKGNISENQHLIFHLKTLNLSSKS